MRISGVSPLGHQFRWNFTTGPLIQFGNATQAAIELIMIVGSAPAAGLRHLG
jgi:hypothetical protein